MNHRIEFDPGIGVGRYSGVCKCNGASGGRALDVFIADKRICQWLCVVRARRDFSSGIGHNGFAREQVA